MKKIYAIVTLSFVIWLISCQKNSMQKNVTVVDAGVGMLIENRQGQNLLDPKTSGYYMSQDIKIINVINGQEKVFFESNWDSPYEFVISELLEKYYISFRPTMATKDQEITTTYIEWTPSNRDKIECKFFVNTSGPEYSTVVSREI